MNLEQDLRLLSVNEFPNDVLEFRKRVYEPLRLYAYSIIKKFDTSEYGGDDLVDDMVSYAVERLPRFDPNKGSGTAQSWIYGAMINCIREKYNKSIRDKKRNPVSMDSFESVDSFDLFLSGSSDVYAPQTKLIDQEFLEYIKVQLMNRKKGIKRIKIGQLMDILINKTEIDYNKPRSKYQTNNPIPYLQKELGRDEQYITRLIKEIRDEIPAIIKKYDKSTA